MRLIIIAWISFVSTIQLVWCNSQLPAPELKIGPKDYSFAPKNARVLDLVNFFESMNRANVEDPLAYRKINTIISLGEAASKLHTLSDSYPLEVKCDKYVKLITKPNIRTFATVQELMKESKLFNEVLQVDANLVSRLQDEREFDALGRMQTILQSLESEKTLGVSNYELIVQKDLLDCVNYYIYRHQRATFGVVHQVRQSMDKLPRSLTEYGGSEVLLRKFRDTMAKIRELETAGEFQFDHLAWTNELSKVHELVIENNYEVPLAVQEFITEPARLERLNLIERAPKRANHLTKLIVDLEEENPMDLNSNSEYLEDLRELYDLYVSYKDILSKEIREFIEMPERWRVIQDNLSNIGQDVIPVEKQVIPPQPTTTTSPPPITTTLTTPRPITTTTTTPPTTTTTPKPPPLTPAPTILPPIVFMTSSNFNQDHANNVRAHKRKIHPALLKSKQTIKTKMGKRTKQNARVKATQVGHKQTTTDMRLECNKLLVQFKLNLVSFNLKSIDLDKAKLLTQDINYFKINCSKLYDQNNYPNGDVPSSNNEWPMESLVAKIIIWSRSQLKDSLLAADQHYIDEIKSLRQILSEISIHK